MAMLAQMVEDVVVSKFELEDDVTIVGRITDCAITINDSSVSTNHAKITRRPNPDFPESIEYYISDMGSTNGTEVNGAAVTSEVLLRHEDEVKFALNTFVFLDEKGRDFEKTVHLLK